MSVHPKCVCACHDGRVSHTKIILKKEKRKMCLTFLMLDYYVDFEM